MALKDDARQVVSARRYTTSPIRFPEQGETFDALLRPPFTDKALFLRGVKGEIFASVQVQLR
jgi:hypothetical protein